MRRWVRVNVGDLEHELAGLGFVKSADQESTLVYFIKNLPNGIMLQVRAAKNRDVGMIGCMIVSSYSIPIMALKYVQRTRGWQQRLRQRIRAMETFCRQLPVCPVHITTMLPVSKKTAHRLTRLHEYLFVCPSGYATGKRCAYKLEIPKKLFRVIKNELE